ncbi:glucuronyl hydrolase, partial [Micromonospora sp. NPDC047753]
GETEQGHADHSCWARGQAWGIYGFSLNHRHIGDPALLAAARTCADRFLADLPDDHVAYWDLEFGDGSGQERDSSAAAIAACGLVELADGLGDDTASADRYRKAAAEILRSLIAHYSTGGHPASNALILHGVYDKPKSVGVDEGTLWGDYFYLEALARATIPGWTSPW